MDVYLVRHAIADHRNPARWPDDARRPLTTKGAVRFRSAASGLHRLIATVDVVLASPYIRAWLVGEPGPGRAILRWSVSSKILRSLDRGTD
jgi:hypothetical protein